MGCCGRDRRLIFSMGRRNSVQPGALYIPLDEDVMLIEYMGELERPITFYGTSTGSQYKVSSGKRTIEVDARDTQKNGQGKLGLLDLQLDHKPVFRIVEKPH